LLWETIFPFAQEFTSCRAVLHHTDRRTADATTFPDVESIKCWSDECNISFILANPSLSLLLRKDGGPPIYFHGQPQAEVHCLELLTLTTSHDPSWADHKAKLGLTAGDGAISGTSSHSLINQNYSQPMRPLSRVQWSTALPY